MSFIEENETSVNVSDSAKESLDECEEKLFTAIPIMLIILSVLGIVGNILVIYLIVVLQEYKKTITNLYLVQLAVSDLLFMIFLPVEAHGLVKGNTATISDSLCKLYQTLRFLSYYSSVFFLTVMSLDRYLAINHAMTTLGTKLRKKRAVHLASLGVWLLCFGSVLPITLRSGVKGCKCSTDFVDTREYFEEDYSASGDGASGMSGYGDDSLATTAATFRDGVNTTTTEEAYDYSGEADYDMTSEQFNLYLISIGELPCSFQHTPSMVKSALWNFIGAFAIPLVIIILCYIKILMKISKPAKSGAKSSNSANARKRVTKMVILLVTTFIICWLPYHIFQLARIRGIPITLSQCTTVREWLSILAYANSVLNPVLYTFMGTNIRTRWKEVMQRTRSFRPSFGSKSEYQTAKRSKRVGSHTGDGNSFSSKSTGKNLQTVVSRMPQSEDGLL